MKLITEHTEDIQYIVEDVGSEKQYLIDGIFMQAETLNRNHRVYPKKVLERAVNTFINEKIDTGRSMGELNHPDGPNINPVNVSHRITKLEWNGNDVVGRALILDTPMGTIVKGLLKGGCKLGVSSRGMGTVANKSGRTTVNDDYVLNTVDIVQDPSAPAAFVNGIMEGVEWIYDNGLFKPQQIESYETEVKSAPAARLAETQMRIWQDFLSKL